MFNAPLPRLASLTIAATLSFALVSCSPEVTETTESPRPPALSPEVSEPVLTREQALDEAMGVLAQYSVIADQVSSDYSVDASLLSPYATDDEIDVLRSFQHKVEAAGLRLIGPTIYSNEQIQEMNSASGELVVLVCADSSQVRLVDETGTDVTPVNRPDTSTSRITFTMSANTLKVKENVAWDGASVC